MLIITGKPVKYLMMNSFSNMLYFHHPILWWLMSIWNQYNALICFTNANIIEFDNFYRWACQRRKITFVAELFIENFQWGVQEISIYVVSVHLEHCIITLIWTGHYFKDRFRSGVGNLLHSKSQMNPVSTEKKTPRGKNTFWVVISRFFSTPYFAFPCGLTFLQNYITKVYYIHAIYAHTC